MSRQEAIEYILSMSDYTLEDLSEMPTEMLVDMVCYDQNFNEEEMSWEQ